MNVANISDRRPVGHRKSSYWVQDSLFLAVVTILSSLFYVSRLGFYWDDWQVLKIFHFSPEQGLIGLTRAVFVAWPEMRARPVQAFQWALVYDLFGRNPLAYHLLNTASFLFGLCMFYLALRTLTERRLISVATAVLYGLLPHYSTDRVWYAILVANLSMALYFLSLFADLKQVTWRSWLGPWKVVSSASLVLSLLAYELFMPFFLLNPVLVAIKRVQFKWTGKTKNWGAVATCLSFVTNLVLIILISNFKQRTSQRSPTGGQFGWWLADNTWTGSIDLTFRSYLLNLPHILSVIWHNYWNWSSFLITAAVVILIASYLIRIARVSGERLPHWAVLVLLILAGTSISGASYSYLYSFYQVNTGVNNRVAIASASTVAVAWMATAALISRFASRQAKANVIFCLLIAILCGCGCLINNTIASFWVAASEKQNEILSGMKQHFPSPPPGSSILLTGLCAWNGPGIVFEAAWDVGGALALLYDDRMIKGELLWPWLEAHEDGIPSGRDQSNKTTMYSFTSLYVYDVRSKQAVRVPDSKTARDFINTATQENIKNNGCVTAGFGTGLAIW
jgi:hypothetical protein